MLYIDTGTIVEWRRGTEGEGIYIYPPMLDLDFWFELSFGCG